MTTLSQYDGWTVEGVVARNSHELTAMHLLRARDHIREQAERHRTELADLRAYIDDAARIGNRVLNAQSNGRKTIRINQVVNP